MSASGKGSIEFRIPESQRDRLEEWIRQTESKVAKEQVRTRKGPTGFPLSDEEIRRIRKSIAKGNPMPRYGVIGGAYRYGFVPNSIGVVITVENVVSGDSIDLSEYEMW